MCESMMQRVVEDLAVSVLGVAADAEERRR
jgi:hypothetical protein